MRSIIEENNGKLYVMTKKSWYSRWKYSRSRFDDRILEFSTREDAEEYIKYGSEPMTIKTSRTVFP
jgi:hypothetical protein